jgi:hypothetical protein
MCQENRHKLQVFGIFYRGGPDGFMLSARLVAAARLEILSEP